MGVLLSSSDWPTALFSSRYNPQIKVENKHVNKSRPTTVTLTFIRI